MENGNNDVFLGEYKPIIEECENFCFVIKKIEEEISEQYNKKENKNQKCYLIELNNYENFKQKINYKIFKDKINEYREQMLTKIIMLESEEKNAKFEKLQNTILKSIKELNNLLKDKHEFILINAEISKEIIQNKEEGQYFLFYSFNSSELILKINNDSLNFHLKENIINLNNLKNKEFFNNNGDSDNCESNNINSDSNNLINNHMNYNNKEIKDDLKELLDWMEKFYLSEKQFKNSLNKKKENDKNKNINNAIKNFGYLMELKNFNEWKNKLNYDSIKPIIDKYINEGKDFLTDEEKEEIIQLLKDQDIKKDKIESVHFRSMDELKHYNKLNDMILINRELFILINDKEEKPNEIEYNISMEKKLDIIINNEKSSFFRLENIIYSYISFNLFLLTKIFIKQNDFFKEKKGENIYIYKKDFLKNYKEFFNYENLQKIFKTSNLTNKNNEKQIFEFIENISVTYISSIKEKIFTSSIKFEKNNIDITKIKSKENISFEYIKDFDKMLFDGNTVINFNNHNSVPKGVFLKVKLFFINEKILILFKDIEQNQIFGQIGNMKDLENNYCFDVDYLIAIKKGKNESNLLDNFLKEKKGIDNFYHNIYGDNSKNFFEYIISEDIILYIYNFKLINNTNQITDENENKANPFFQNNIIPNEGNQLANFNDTSNNINIPVINNEINEQVYQKDNNPDNCNNTNQNLQNDYNEINIPNPFKIEAQNNGNKNNINNINEVNTTQIVINNSLGQNNILDNNYIDHNNINYNDNNNNMNINQNGQNFQEIGNNYDPNPNQNVFNPIQGINPNVFNTTNNNNNVMDIENQMSMNNNNFTNQNQIVQPMYDFNKIKHYLYVIISFLYSDQNIKMKMNRINNQSWNNKENLYIINKQWVNAFLSIFNINNEITTSINSIPNMSSNIQNIIENIIPALSENTKQYFNNLDYNNYIGKLTDNSLIKIDEQYMNNIGTNIRILFNFYFLEESFCNCLSHYLNLNLSPYWMKSECILINQKIFSFTNDDNVYVGNFGMDYSFYTEKIIFYHNLEAKNEIINMVQANNFNYFNYLLFSGDLISNGFNIQMLNLNYQKSIKNALIIEKLKDFINFDIYKNKLIEETNETNRNEDNIAKEEVILIKKESLNLIGYFQIINIFKKYIQSLGKINPNQLIDNIFNNLNVNDIQLLKQEFNKIANINIKLDDILPKPDSLISFEDKNISIFNDVLVIKKDLIKLFLNKTNIEHEYIKEIVSGNGMNIIIIKKNEEKTLLLGNLINNEHTFKLQYIFNFKDGYELEKGLKKIYKSHIDYIDKYCMFEKDESLISPVFNRKEELIGYSYKYDDNLLSVPLYEYYLCDNLKNVIQLFNYYTFLNNKIQNENNSYHNHVTLSPREYCLVKKSWIENFKECFSYNNITSEISSGKEIINIIQNNKQDNSESTDKNIFTTLKGLNNNMYLSFNSDLRNKAFQNFDLEPTLVSTGYIDSSKIQQQFFIPNDFEIMPKKFIEKYKGENNQIDQQNINEIQIIDSLLMINFEYNLNASEKFISLIGELNFNNSFEIKSVLVYYRSFQKEEILQEEQYSLHNIISQKERRYFKSQYENRDSENYDECFVYQFNPNSSPMDNNNNNFIIPDDNNEFIKVNEIEYDLDYQPIYPFIKNNFQYPPLIGLDNIGATCYMNATLQCFCNIEQFVNYFKYDKNLIYNIKYDPKKETLNSSFKLLIEKLWPNNYPMGNQKKSYSPHEFKTKISIMNPLFQGIAANDSKDLVNFLIMKLHEELNVHQNQINDSTFNLDQTNMALMFNTFTQNFNANNNSIISKLFYAFNYNVTECQNCHVNTFNFQTYFFLIFPLEEVRKFKLSNNQFMNYNNIMMNNNEVTIYDCFNYDKTPNIMSGQNMMYCNYCRQTCNSSMCTLLCTGPEILIIILNRGKGIEFKVKINFLEDLNLNGYISMPNTGCFYKLIGVITHLGESGMGGHFIAYCKNPINYQWNKYNDSTVTPVYDFKGEVIDYAMPYLLFYQKQH